MGRASRPHDQRLSTALRCLHHLRPHLRAQGFAVTGSLAMHLLGLRHRRVLDVDLVATDPDVVRPSVTTSFLVSHYHLSSGNSPGFMIQLVDPRSRFRIDIFPDLDGGVVGAMPRVLGDHSFLVVQASDIFGHKLQTLRSSRRDRPVDPKHLDDVRFLADLLGKPTLDLPLAHLEPDRFETSTTQACVRCHESRSEAFPLAPKQQIVDVLGYV